ncbi:hypothetical protein [Brachyspira alvinipulli]|uniref:hypothetical protein n=1 Tax=Brachyspira alvinipulli TaxID=84379 RepID=UPI0004AFC445|nr:hypothetical protein [Brachyspira alvinipulli]
MTKTLKEYDFIQEFESNETYKNNFSRIGLIELFEYLEEFEEETNEQIEFDIVALCCDYGELTENEYKKEYNITDIDEDEYIIRKFKNYNDVDSVLYYRH